MGKRTWDRVLAVVIGALGAFGTYVLVPGAEPWFIVVVFLWWAAASYYMGTKR